MSLASRRSHAPTSMQMPPMTIPALTLQREREGPAITAATDATSTPTAASHVARRALLFSTPSRLSLDSIGSLPAYDGFTETDNPDVITTSCEVPDSPLTLSRSNTAQCTLTLSTPPQESDPEATPRPGTRKKRGRRRSFTSFFKSMPHRTKQPVSMTVHALPSPGIQVAHPFYLPSRDPTDVRSGFTRTLPPARRQASRTDGDDDAQAGLFVEDPTDPPIDPLYWFATLFELNTLLAKGGIRQAQQMLAQDARLADKVSLVKRSEAAELEALSLRDEEVNCWPVDPSVDGGRRSRSVSPHIVRTATAALIGVPHPLHASAFQFPSEQAEGGALHATESLTPRARSSRASSTLSAQDALDMARRGSAVSTTSTTSNRSSLSSSFRLRKWRDKLNNLTGSREAYVLLFE